MDDRDAIARAIDEQEDTLVALCGRLVAAPSVSPPGDTRAVAEVVREELDRGGLDPEIAARDPMKPSILASVQGREPGPHLIMNVHLDTMPVGDESAWSLDPWSLTERAGRLYGLGMGNMKGAVAAMTIAVRELASRRERWSGRITFAAVADEVMFGDDGAAWLLATRPELTGDAMLCGEGPGWMRMAVAEKGVAWYELRADGPAGHTSRAQPGTSAIAKLAAVASELDAITGRPADLPPELGGMPSDPGDPGTTVSLNVATFEGGSVISQLPIAARATADARTPPGISLATLDGLIDDACRRVDGVSWQRLKGWEANWTEPTSPIVRAVADAATHVRGTPPELAVRLPASDASRWRARGVPAVCYGPQPTFSAGVDDYAERRDVVDCAKIYALAALMFLS